MPNSDLLQSAPTTRRPGSLTRTKVRRAGVAGCVLAVAAALGACEADGPRAMSLDERVAAVPMQADAFNTLGYRVEWRGFATMLPGSTVESFQILGDALAITESQGVFTILEARSGAQRWSDQAAGPLTRFFPPLRAGTIILLPTETDVFLYDAATGTLKNKHRLPEVASTRPVLVGDALAYGAASGHVVAISAASGFQIWGSGLAGSIDTEPVVLGAGPEAIFASQAGDTAVLDVLSGRGIGRSKMFAGPGANIGAGDSLAFIASLDHSLYAISRSSGRVVWRHRTDAPLRQPPAVIDNQLYVDLGASGGFTAFDPTTGKILWQNDTVTGAAVALRKNRVLVMNAGGSGKPSTVVTLDPKTGRTADTVELTNISMLIPESAKDATLYAVSPLGVITRLAPR